MCVYMYVFFSSHLHLGPVEPPVMSHEYEGIERLVVHPKQVVQQFSNTESILSLYGTPQILI